jgi:hypothetical protein
MSLGAWAGRARLEKEDEAVAGVLEEGAGARFGEVAAQGARRTPELGEEQGRRAGAWQPGRGLGVQRSRGELHARELRTSARRQGERVTRGRVVVRAVARDEIGRKAKRWDKDD